MDELDGIVPVLAQLITLRAEQQIVERLRGGGATADLDPGECQRYLVAEVLAVASDILDLPWSRNLPIPWVRTLEELLGHRRSAEECIAGLLRAGCGRAACERAPGGLIWIPVWIVALAEARSESRIDVVAERWAIPPGWPVPTAQCLVSGVPDLARFDLAYYRTCPLGNHLQVPAPEYPQDWWHQTTGSLPRAARSALLAADPCAGVRALLSVPGDALTGIAQEIALLILQQVQRLAGEARAWRGEWNYSCVVLVEGQPALEAGWLNILLGALGVSCMGMSKATTYDAERSLITAAGGELFRLQGGGEVHRLPFPAGRVLMNLGVSWEQVPALT